MQISTPCKRACTKVQSIQQPFPLSPSLPSPSTLSSILFSSTHIFHRSSLPLFISSSIHASSSHTSSNHIPYALIKKYKQSRKVQKKDAKNSRTPPKLIVEHMSRPVRVPIFPASHAYPVPRRSIKWYIYGIGKPFFAVLCSVFRVSLPFVLRPGFRGLNAW